jgi:hypothetical protein
MLPPEDWDEERPPTMEGENLTYRKELCPNTSARSARSRYNSLRQAWTYGVHQRTKRAARKIADALGWTADRFTHLAFLFFRRPKWTAINRHSFALLHRIGQRFDRAAIWFLLRSR